jgi:glycosyltransferase involved in cell wall biosynthesis
MADPSQTCSDALPLVTVAMPVFNAGRYLRPAVVSIIRQTFTDWELLIIDDGSSDSAVDDILDLDDARIRILRNGSNRGIAARLNEAIDLARGRYFARMDSDDISYPERLASQLAVLEQNSALDIVAVRCVAIDADNELVGALPYALAHENICARPWLGFHFAHPTWLGKIEWFRRHRYASPAPYFCEDQELLLRSYRASRFATVPEIMFAYRVRTRINWVKSVKTRNTLLQVQLNHFIQTRQFYFGMLAMAGFVARVAMDSLNLLAQIFGSLAGIRRHDSVAVDENEKLRWRVIAGKLISKGR